MSSPEPRNYRDSLPVWIVLSVLLLVLLLVTGSLAIGAEQRLLGVLLLPALLGGFGLIGTVSNVMRLLGKSS